MTIDMVLKIQKCISVEYYEQINVFGLVFT